MKIRAEYRKHPLKQCCGNPLIEALHFEMNTKALIERVKVTLEDHIDINALPTIYKNVLIQELGNVHIPLPQFTTIYQKCAALLLSTYQRRNPFNPEANKIKHLLGEQLHSKSRFSMDMVFNRTTAPSVLIEGISGAGKTTVIRNALWCVPQVIEHKEYNGVSFQQSQVVWLSFDMPATPSLKALALNFFSAVDDALGTSYYSQWQKKSRLSVDSHLNAVRLVAETHMIGLVHIDELQFMLNYAKTKDTPSLSVLEALFNKIGIPVILSCTSEGIDLLRPEVALNGGNSPNMTTTRRVCNDRELRLTTHKQGSAYFEELFYALFPWGLGQYGPKEINKFKETFFFLSCGLPAVMSRLARLYYELKFDLIDKKTIKHALRDIEAEINLLGSVYKNQFSLIAPALHMLRHGHTDKFETVVRNTSKSSKAFTNGEIAKQNPNASMPQVIKSGHEPSTSAPSSVGSSKGIASGFKGEDL